MNHTDLSCSGTLKEKGKRKEPAPSEPCPLCCAVSNSLHLELAKLGQGVLLRNGSLPRDSKIPKLRHGAVSQCLIQSFRELWEMLDHWAASSHLLVGEMLSPEATASNWNHLLDSL